MNCTRLAYILVIVVIATSVPYKSFSDDTDNNSLTLITAPIIASIVVQRQRDECFKILKTSCHSSSTEYCLQSPEDRLKEDLLRCAIKHLFDETICINILNSCEAICQGVPDEQRTACLEECRTNKKTCTEEADLEHMVCHSMAEIRFQNPDEFAQCINVEYSWCVTQANEICVSMPINYIAFCLELPDKQQPDCLLRLR